MLAPTEWKPLVRTREDFWQFVPGHRLGAVIVVDANIG